MKKEYRKPGIKTTFHSLVYRSVCLALMHIAEIEFWKTGAIKRIITY